MAGIFENVVGAVALPREVQLEGRGQHHRVLDQRFVTDRIRAGRGQPLDDSFLIAVGYGARVRADCAELHAGHEIGGLDDERIAFPMAARHARPVPQRLGRGAAPVERNDARLVDHLHADHDIAGRLEDLDAGIIIARQHAAGQAARDAAVEGVEIIHPSSSAGRSSCFSSPPRAWRLPRSSAACGHWRAG